jgi:uncharacterized protein
MTAAQQRLTFITLGARDVKAQADFYKGLGWEVSAEAPDGFTAFHCGGVMLALWPLESLAHEAAPGAAAPASGWNGVALASNVDRKEQVDEVYAQWVAAGATPVTEPFDLDWGGRTSYVADPEGNRWEFCWNPAVVFDEKGGVTGLAE